MPSRESRLRACSARRHVCTQRDSVSCLTWQRRTVRAERRAQEPTPHGRTGRRVANVAQSTE